MSSLVFFIIFFIGLSLCPLVWRLTLAVCSSIFQLYTFPLFGIYPSIALLSSFSCGTKIRSFIPALQQIPILILLTLMTWQAICLIWSPDIHLGLATILYESPFIAIFCATYLLLQSYQFNLEKIFKIYTVISLAPIFTLVLFRIHFELDTDFLQTSFAQLIINPNTLANSPYNDNYVPFNFLIYQLIHRAPNAGSWLQDKPHSFFMNPNTCAGYLGICSLLFWGAASYIKTNWIKGIAILHWLGLFLIASVAAMLLGVFLPLIILFIFYWQKNVFNFNRKFILFFSFFLTTLFIFIINRSPVLIYIFQQKLAARLVLWKAAHAIHHGHWLFGLGFGGWQLEYTKYRLSVPENPMLQPFYPPHNTLIQLWTQSGLPAVILGAIFMFSCLYICWRAFKTLKQKNEKIFSLCVMAAFTWVFLQGMGENWGINSEMHVQPILAICFALIIHLYNQALSKKSTD